MNGVELTTPQALNVLLTFTPRILDFIKWLVFAVFHLSLLALTLLLFWLFQVTPKGIYEWGQHLLQLETVQGTVAVLGFAGVSGLAALTAYVRLWRKIYASITTNYLMKGL